MPAAIILPRAEDIGDVIGNLLVNQVPANDERRFCSLNRFQVFDEALVLLLRCNGNDCTDLEIAISPAFEAATNFKQHRVAYR
jgi:hypothetical protein